MRVKSVRLVVHMENFEASFFEAKTQHGRPRAYFNKEGFAFIRVWGYGVTSMHLMIMLLSSTNKVSNKVHSSYLRCCCFRSRSSSGGTPGLL